MPRLIERADAKFVRARLQVAARAGTRLGSLCSARARIYAIPAQPMGSLCRLRARKQAAEVPSNLRKCQTPGKILWLGPSICSQ